MSYLDHNSVRIILLNEKNELLLMNADDPSTTSIDGTYNGPFWFLLGGGIEENEALDECAIREIFEETGIKKDKLELGPTVWFGEFDLMLSGQKRRMKQKFIVVKTKQSEVTLANLTPNERKVVKKLQWFSFEQIKTCDEIIYPPSLARHLPDILAGKFPENPIEIELD